MDYRTLSGYLLETFGTKVYKLSLVTGCTCPNRDGTAGTGGCTFCSAGGSGEFAAPLLPVSEQIRVAKQRVDRKFPRNIAPENRRYIAYVQSYPNTYGDPEVLLDMFQDAISFPEIAALSIGTRPDCLDEPVLSMLSSLNRQKPVWVELGLQTIHEKTAAAVNRGYSLNVFEQSYRRLKEQGLTVIVHLILGFPQETREDMLDSVRYLAALNPAPDGVKLQQLQILRGTALAEEYAADPFPLMTLEEYADLITDCLRLLPKETVVHRITGDGPKRLLVAPLWCADKKRVLNTLYRKIRDAV